MSPRPDHADHRERRRRAAARGTAAASTLWTDLYGEPPIVITDR